MSLRLCVVVPGLGDPHWEHKVQILEHNRGVLSHFPGKVEWYISQYEMDKSLPINDDTIHVTKGKGILGRNIKANASPSQLQLADDDYVMILLDDVELVGQIDWQCIMQLMQQTDTHIVSPSLTEHHMSAWNFMIREPHEQNVIMKVMTRCELFCYFMKAETYKKYYHFVDADNPWMWGMDFMLRNVMQFNVGIMNHVHMIHHYWRRPNKYKTTHDPYEDSVKYLSKHNTNWDEVKSLPTVVSYVLST